jgi:nitrogenase molybdenum-iron protein NifN
MKSGRNFVNLNVNPCKVCMPLGAATAFKGIENSVVIMHGSQGCSTYIRRHMAAHYNEPIDIASSSLNEKGTVYGGANNLKKGLNNIIKLYNPGVVGIITTCLAETIGENLQGIVQEFATEKPEESEDREFITVSTPGYGGSEHEGYYAALKSIVEKITLKKTTTNKKVNIIVGNMTPGDVRRIKNILEDFDIDFIMLPDISDTLDAPFSMQYKKIPAGGTKIKDIQEMSDSCATIEMGMFVGDEISPGKYLEKEFNVPLYKCPLPIGLGNTDIFVNLLSFITVKNTPIKYTKERGRMLDAFVDSHKFNGEARAAIFGDPETVYSTAKACFEAGIFPVLISSGTKAAGIEEMLKSEMQYYFEKHDEKTMIIEDTDFETIYDYIKQLKVNVTIGNSNGKFITEKEGIPLVRIGFPVHDRMGAQRKVSVGYEGSLSFIDEITNSIIERKYSTYRSRMFNKYYEEVPQ